jgi:hypothetical protein
MRILKTTRSYVLIFCTYALVALVSVRNLFRNSSHSVVPPPLSFQIPATVGMVCCAIALPGLLEKTSNTFEKTAIVLTEGVCILWLAGVLPKFGLAWAVIPYYRYFLAILVCVAAALVGVRLFEVLRQQKTDQGA